MIYSNVTFRNPLGFFGEKSSRPPYPFIGFNLTLRVKLDNKNKARIHQTCTLFNSNPPEAAPLLDPCLKVTQKLDKLTNPAGAIFKNLARRKQHPC